MFAWLAVCAAFAALDLADALDGLLVPVPLILALVFARAAGTNGRGAYASRLVAAVVAAACLPMATFVWLFGVGVGEMSPTLVVTALLAFAALLTVLLIPSAAAPFLRALGLDPASSVHRVVAVAFVLTVLDAVALFFELREAGPVEVPFYPADPLVSVTTDLALALAGVGFGLTRGVRESVARLGVRSITRRQIVIAVVVAALFQVLVGGLEQGVALPSVNWLVGLRTKEGAEFGIGPNITPLGVGLVVAAGTTFRAGILNIPVNFAMVPSKSGIRVSILTGFNTKRR